jgi:hypothetical protein
MQLPGPVRAMVGLVASAADEAKNLPDRAIELPMLAVSTALQVSLRAQQRYARLAARGDAVLNHRSPSDEPPPWATFDDPVPADELDHRPAPDPARTMRAATRLLDELLGEADGAEVPSKLPAKEGPAKKLAAKKAPAKNVPAERAGPAKKAPAKKAAAQASAKKISKPRHVTPSRFDDVE